jgi:hypothetical protein
MEETAKKEKDIQYSAEVNKRLLQSMAALKESEKSLRERLEKHDRDSISFSLSLFFFPPIVRYL